jgi:hypothetical protein
MVNLIINFRPPRGPGKSRRKYRFLSPFSYPLWFDWYM